MLILLSFSNSEHTHGGISGVELRINTSGEGKFLEEQDVMQLILQQEPRLKIKSLNLIDVPRLEKNLDNHSHILKSELSIRPDGVLQVEIQERRPIARVINYLGESFYLDDTGKLMELSDDYSAYVPVFTGMITERYASSYRVDYSTVLINDSLLKTRSLYSLYYLAKYIDSEDFWRAQIDQVHVSKDIELIPKVGSHTIVLGDVQGLQDKFKRLRYFYREGLPKQGWNVYSVINLKYKGQVVCTVSPSFRQMKDEYIRKQKAAAAKHK